MALTNNNLEMIKALSKNDIHAAKTAAIASLAEDKSKKNSGIIEYYRKLLLSGASIVMSNLPGNVKTFLVGEAPGNFNPNRYYVRDTEQNIADNIYKMKLVADEMSNRHISYANTTLLYGKSGTGKTELGKYIAYKLNLPFFYVSFSSIIDSYLGSTAKNIHNIFEFCNSIPCVLMLDEIDCIAMKRSSNTTRGADGEIERTTISIMQELDQLANHVVLIAATNRLDIIDEALLRRFSIKAEITNMSTDDLYNMCKLFITDTNTSQYITDSQLKELVSNYHNPGQLMPNLIRHIGNAVFEEKKDELIEIIEESNKLNLFEVTYTWKINIEAETEEDAIALARNARNNYQLNKNAISNYSAKRAEFIVNDGGNNTL